MKAARVFNDSIGRWVAFSENLNWINSHSHNAAKAQSTADVKLTDKMKVTTQALLEADGGSAPQDIRSRHQYPSDPTSDTNRSFNSRSALSYASLVENWRPPAVVTILGTCCSIVVTDYSVTCVDCDKVPIHATSDARHFRHPDVPIPPSRRSSPPSRPRPASDTPQSLGLVCDCVVGDADRDRAFFVHTIIRVQRPVPASLATFLARVRTLGRAARSSAATRARN
jgi:hypothetical protein